FDCVVHFSILEGDAVPVRRREVYVRRNEVDQVMGYAASLCKRDLRRGDLNALVNLHRVTVDDFAAKTQRQLDSQLALARSRRTNDGDDAGSAGVPPAFQMLIVRCVGLTHPRAMISRIAMTSQMMESNRMAPII